MLVVVQTYPAHFYQTLACLKSIRSLNPSCEIWLFADDFSNFSWGAYISSCHTAYQGLVDRIIPFSDQPALYRLRSWPWLRQQTNKLLLDTFIPKNEWLFIDGDVQLHAWPLPNAIYGSLVPYAGVPLHERDPQPGEMSSQVLFYVTHMLGQAFNGFWTDDARYITSSHPPVKHMHADVIRSLRTYIEGKFARTLIDIHLDLANDLRMAACEWDLIEAYKQTVLHQDVIWTLDHDFFQTTWCADRELGEGWFRQRDIVIDPDIWAVLPEGKNYL